MDGDSKHDPYDVVVLVWDYLDLLGYRIELKESQMPHAKHAASELLRALGITPEIPPATD